MTAVWLQSYVKIIKDDMLYNLYRIHMDSYKVFYCIHIILFIIERINGSLKNLQFGMEKQYSF